MIDNDGRSIEDPSTIAAVVLKEVRGLIAHDVLQGRLNLDQRLEVEDETGAVVYVAHFGDALQVTSDRRNLIGGERRGSIAPASGGRARRGARPWPFR